MPIEVATAISAAASASNALVTLCKHGLHYKEVPEEIEQFRHALDNLESSINTSKRLRRVKSDYLDNHTKAEVDATINRSEAVLDGISRTIEGCRADVATKGTVSAKNRLDWMLRGQQTFMARGMTLNTCLQNLSMQVGRMDAMQPPATTHSQNPPTYKDSLLPEQTLRAPSVRKARSRLASQTSFSNMSTFSFCTEKEVTLSREASNDTASIYSYDEFIPARVSSVPNLTTTCDGDYCTDELCTNHTRQENSLEHTMSLDSSFRFADHDSVTPIPTETFGPQRPFSQRRRNRSGLI